MTKRRTRKEKSDAKYQFVVDINKLVNSEPPKPIVKREKNFVFASAEHKGNNQKNAKPMAKDRNLASVRKDIAKSLSLAFLILGIELMIYLFG